MPDLPAPPPLCQEKFEVDSSPPGAVLRCDLPAGHRSEEHYDRAQRALWIPAPTGPQLTVGGLIPSPRLRDDEPWPDHGA